MVFDVQLAQHISGYPYLSVFSLDERINVAFKRFSGIFQFGKWSKIVRGRIIHLNSYICADKQMTFAVFKNSTNKIVG